MNLGCEEELLRRKLTKLFTAADIQSTFVLSNAAPERTATNGSSLLMLAERNPSFPRNEVR
jgi:hypothetical protein